MLCPLWQAKPCVCATSWLSPSFSSLLPSPPQLCPPSHYSILPLVHCTQPSLSFLPLFVPLGVSSLKPDYADAYCDLGCTYCALGEVDQAKACFMNALKYNPHHLEVGCGGQRDAALKGKGCGVRGKGGLSHVYFHRPEGFDGMGTGTCGG